MTEAATTEAPLAPLPLTDEQLAVIQALYPHLAIPVPPPASAPERVVVKPPRDSKLEGLLAQYKPFKDAKEQAENRFKELNKAITSELEDMYQGAKRPTEAYEVPASTMWPALTVAYRVKEYLPAPKIREFLPAVYKAFATTSRYSEVRESTVGRKRKR